MLGSRTQWRRGPRERFKISTTEVSQTQAQEGLHADDQTLVGAQRLSSGQPAGKKLQSKQKAWSRSQGVN